MRIPVLVGVLFLTSIGASAQTENARISGRVTDPTDAVIAGAACTITNLETNVSIVTTTNQDGIYVIPDLRPATYRVPERWFSHRRSAQPAVVCAGRGQ